MSAVDGSPFEEELDPSPEHDLTELMSKCKGEFDFSFTFRISMGRFTLEEIKKLVRVMGRGYIRIGDGLTLLHMCAQFDHDDIAEYLITECQHPLEDKTVAGETALDQASWRGCIATAMVLLKAGADRNCQTKLGYTPLHRCAFYNHPRLASILCLAGASLTIKDHDGETPYDVAISKGRTQLAKTLKPLVDSDGRIIEMYARNNPKHPEYRPEATKALWSLFEMESRMAATDDNDDGNDEEDEEEEDAGEEDEVEEEEAAIKVTAPDATPNSRPPPEA